jgi:hypothetical protein
MTRRRRRSGSSWKARLTPLWRGWVGRNLQRHSPLFEGEESGVFTLAVETQGSILQGGAVGKHKVEGIGVSFIPETFHRQYCDRIVAVNDEDAFGMVKRLAAEEGLLGGSSAGAIVHAAAELAKELGPGKRVAVIIPDSAERYFRRTSLRGACEAHSLRNSLDNSVNAALRAACAATNSCPRAADSSSSHPGCHCRPSG